MKKTVLLLFLFAGLIASAQTQQGFVKTKGRMDAKGNLVPGQGLKGATVSVKGRTHVLVNAESGAFSFPVTEQQFRLDSVKKKGYQLVDKDACPRSYNYSKNPLYIVMETPDQQLQDQLTAERKIRRNLQKQLQEKEDAIETMKAQQKISDEAYRQALQQLYQDQESNEQLIKDMARRYAELDYDQLDDFYRQVSFCIENGELVKADSLLQTKGDVAKQVEEQVQRSQAIHEKETELDKAKAVHAADQAELARRCYSYFETCAARHLNDSAAYYLELRATLDTSNVEWQTEAGLFIANYLADYNTALSHYQTALKQVLATDGLLSPWTAILLDDIGAVSSSIGDYNSALSYHEKALTITRQLFGDDDPETASCYNNMGSAHYYLGAAEKALDYHNKALEIRKNFYGERHPLVATDYNNIGTVYSNQGDYEKALTYLGKALDIWKSTLGDSHPDVAQCYNNIGVVYFQQGDYAKSLEYFKKALAILKPALGDRHPDVTVTQDIIVRATRLLDKGKSKTDHDLR